LAEIRVSDSPPNDQLQRLQEEACRRCGIAYQVCSLPATSDERALAQAVAQLNADPRITGIALHAPAASGARQTFMQAVTPEKDVDGWHPLNLGRLVTNTRPQRAARGREVVYLLKQAGVDLVGAHVICVGNATGLAGVFALLCLHENATITAWRHAHGRPAELLRRGDVVLIDTADWPPAEGLALKPGAVIIDARCPPPGQAAAWPDEAWSQVASLLIPLPGGVGPATVALRLSALVSLYRAQACPASGSR
jgi:methylenetetrahydrofolate dehydrogenase (NADP+)/methenyltetrahydrofolate cyclohydrolase